MLRILLADASQAWSIEQLSIADFYMLYPFLLHRASMPDEVRTLFRTLTVEKEREQFVSLPSSMSLYRELAIYQRTALANLAAKAIISKTDYERGWALIRVESVPPALAARVNEENSSQAAFVDFLAHHLGRLPLEGARGLRKLTGLVRRVG
jgi:hypothetical protein